MKTRPDALYLFFCHLEWRDRRRPDAYQELIAALDDQDAEIRQVAESLLRRSPDAAGRKTVPSSETPVRGGGEEPIPLPTDDSESSDELRINIVENRDGVLVRLSGRVDIDSSPALYRRLLDLLESQRQTTINVDLAGVPYIDSSGVATLIEALKFARSCKSGLRLQGLHDGLLRIFEVTGIVSLFNGNGEITPSGYGMV